MIAKTGFFYNESSLLHQLAEGHPESPRRLQAISEQILKSDAAPFFEHSTASFNRDLHMPAIAAVHSASHYANVLAIPFTGKAAADAVAVILAAVDAVFSGKNSTAFCAVRPPGHHVHNNAHHDGINQGEGFCFFNNVAIAARYAQRHHNAKSVLIVDWDFHHGNGTETVFYEDPSVFYFSTHRLGAYPHTGRPEHAGSGAGTGYTYNYPLPNAVETDWQVVDHHLLEALRCCVERLDEIAFIPDIILISAGFDGLATDPLGDFSLQPPVFHAATEILMELAARSCGGRIVSVLEGGYDPLGMALAVEAHMKALAGLHL